MLSNLGKNHILDCEIDRGRHSPEYGSLLGLPAQHIDRVSLELGQKRLARFSDDWTNHFLDKARFGQGWQVVLAGGRHGGSYDVGGGDAPPLAGQFVPAAWTTYPFQDSLPHERLQHGFEVPGRQVVPGRQMLGGDRQRARMQRHVDDGGDGEQAGA